MNFRGDSRINDGEKGVEENVEEDEGISKFCYIHPHTQIQNSLKTENTLPATMGTGGLVQ